MTRRLERWYGRLVDRLGPNATALVVLALAGLLWLAIAWARTELL